MYDTLGPHTYVHVCTYMYMLSVSSHVNYTLVWLLFFAPLGGPIGAAVPDLAYVRKSNFIIINYMYLKLKLSTPQYKQHCMVERPNYISLYIHVYTLYVQLRT